jgi:hypothetical protein
MNISNIEFFFPNLIYSVYKITSPYDTTYNCIAWAAEDTNMWWAPAPGYYWPADVPRINSLEAYIAVFEKRGYKEVTDDALEPDYKKVAIFTRDGTPTHVSLQLDSGLWTSKLGKSEDIQHDLQGVSGETYGNVAIILKRPK